jgi:hypothetical protein
MFDFGLSKCCSSRPKMGAEPQFRSLEALEEAQSAERFGTNSKSVALPGLATNDMLDPMALRASLSRIDQGVADRLPSAGAGVPPTGPSGARLASMLSGAPPFPAGFPHARGAQSTDDDDQYY